jgi:hypothetical protein
MKEAGFKKLLHIVLFLGLFSGYITVLRFLGALGASMPNSVQYVTVSIPEKIAEAIDSLISDLGYWPSRSAFVREACLDKIYKEQKRLKELRDT